MVENYQKAESDYMAGMKYKDIAEKYGTTINTVKSWKKRYAWNRKEGAPKKEKVCTQKRRSALVTEQIEDGTRETLQNDELTPEQQMFCIYYSRTFNATQSYLNSYKCDWPTANANGSRLLVKASVKAEINRLKDLKRQQILAGAEDIVELQMRIAFADIGDIAEYNSSVIHLKNSKEVDTQLVRRIKETQNGVSVEVEDRQKAIDWLTKYFLMHPDDKYKAEFDRKRAEVGDDTGHEILENMQTIAEILQHPVNNRSIEDFEEKKHEHTGTIKPETV